MANRTEYNKAWTAAHPGYHTAKSKRWREKNREHYREYRREYSKNNTTKIQQHKESLGCSLCGYNKCGAALHWHHLNSESKSTVASNNSNYFGKVGVEERAKCVLLCANCHEETHYQKESEDNGTA